MIAHCSSSKTRATSTFTNERNSCYVSWRFQEPSNTRFNVRARITSSSRSLVRIKAFGVPIGRGNTRKPVDQRSIPTPWNRKRVSKRRDKLPLPIFRTRVRARAKRGPFSSWTSPTLRSIRFIGNRFLFKLPIVGSDPSLSNGTVSYTSPSDTADDEGMLRGASCFVGRESALLLDRKLVPWIA